MKGNRTANKLLHSPKELVGSKSVTLREFVLDGRLDSIFVGQIQLVCWV